MWQHGFRGLYIPCGETKISAVGWVRADNCLDVALSQAPDVKCDMREVAALFPEDHFDMVYCCHGIEHLKRKEVLPAVLGMKAVLKRGGTLRLAVPSADSIISFYKLTQNWDRTCIYLFGRQENDGQIHHCAYTDESLVTLLMEAGLKKIDRWDPSELPWKDNSSHYVELLNGTKVVPLRTSLNLEGVKP